MSEEDYELEALQATIDRLFDPALVYGLDFPIVPRVRRKPYTRAAGPDRRLYYKEYYRLHRRDILERKYKEMQNGADRVDTD